MPVLNVNRQKFAARISENFPSPPGLRKKSSKHPSKNPFSRLTLSAGAHNVPANA
jgi:hypothetical protein